MVRSAPAFSSFTAGEISPKFEGRINIEKYKEGLADLTNMIVIPSGGVTRRPGTEFLGEVKSSNVKTRLFPFQFKASDTYILEFGNQIMRVYRNGAQVLDASAKTITAITQASPGVITSGTHSLSNGDEVFVTGISGMTELNGRNYLVANSTTNTFTLTDLFGNAINTTSFTAYTSGGSATEIFELATPYAEADLFGIRFVQSADTMYLVHPNYDVRKLSRTDHNAWKFSIPIFQGPLEAVKKITAITKANPGVLTVTAHGYSNGDEIALSNIQGMIEINAANFRVANVTTDTFTLTDEAGDNVNTTSFTTFDPGGGVEQVITGASKQTECVITSNDHAFFDDDVIYIQSVGGMTQLNGNHYIVTGATTNTFKIKTLAGVAVDSTGFTTYTSGGTADLTLSSVQKINPVTQALSGANNRPSVVTFFEQRLVFGNTNENPQTLWFSKNADYQNFDTGTAADDALIYTIASNQSDDIRYLSATRVLTIGTGGGEFVLSATSDGPITPTTTVIRKYSNYGSGNAEPVQVADVTLFLQRGDRKVREFKYAGDVDVNAYAAPDMTILAEHITKGGLTQFAYQQEPDSIVWALRSDGTLLGLSYRREEQIVAWHKHVVGGVFGTGQAVVESITTLPTETGEDELYMIVKRTINSVTKRYIEKMNLFDFGSVTTGAFFVDCGLAYNGTATTTLSGLYHLEGETLTVIANGAAHPDVTVSNGSVTLNYSATTAALGFGYTSNMQTMRIESGSRDGTSQGKPKRVHALTARFFETVGAEIGNSSNETDRIPFRSSSDDMDEGIPLFSGDKNIEFPGGFDDDRLYVRQEQALPLTVLALFPRMNTFDL
jgi:hypothetical protein